MKYHDTPPRAIQTAIHVALNLLCYKLHIFFLILQVANLNFKFFFLIALPLFFCLFSHTVHRIASINFIVECEWKKEEE
jgi:hypothetical protein